MKLFFSLFIVLLFIGCTGTSRVKMPVFDKIEPIMYASEGIIWKGIKGEFVTFPIWQEIQNTCIQSRLKANSLIEVNEKYNKTVD